MIIRRERRGRGEPSHVENIIRDPFEVYKLNIIEILAGGIERRLDSER